MDQYDYPLNTFLKRAATNNARALMILKENRGSKIQPDEYKMISLLLLTSIRDIQEEILQPGLKPAQQDMEALASSLLGARYTSASIKAKCQPKKRQPYGPPPPVSTQVAQPSPQPTLDHTKDKKEKPFWRTKNQGNAITQTDP